MTNGNGNEYDELEKMLQKAAVEMHQIDATRQRMLDELMSSIESVIIAAATKEERKEILHRLFELVAKHSNSLN